jgi:hypothetical protein
MGHNIEFNSTTILDKALNYMYCLIKEAMEIRFHPRNFNRHMGFNLSQSQYPLINMI